MKSRMFVAICSMLLITFIYISGCATRKKIISSDEAMKKFKGVYVNTEYSGEGYNHPQKWVLTSDGRWENWALATNKNPSWRGEYKVAESWMDSEGNTYCTVDARTFIHEDKTKELWKLDKSGKILEINFKYAIRGEYPAKIDPNPDPEAVPTLYYLIFYRR
jgi:hypothetical protein